MKMMFVKKNFSKESADLIEIANAILKEYSGMGYRLSLRQLYYQLVARDHVENTVNSYKRIGGIVSDARLAGLMDWNMIEDRGRDAVLPYAWSSPAEIVRAAANTFRVNRWEGQSAYAEVMVEKDALSGILEPICKELHVRFSANKGYSSSSAMYDAGRRIRDAVCDNDSNVSAVHVFYFGDHDPSGIDMTRDVRERLLMFSGLGDDLEDWQIEETFQVHRLALNFDQVETWKPPKNPAKETDSRFASYLKEYGESSWELDAVDPPTLSRLVRDGIEDLIDWSVWDKVAKREKSQRDELLAFADAYDKKEKKAKK